MKTENDIVRYFTGELTREEQDALLRNLEHDETFRQHFIAYKNLHGLMALTGRPGDTAEGRAGWVRFIRERKRLRQKNLFFRVWRYAAAAVLLATVSWTAATYYYRRTLPEEAVAWNTVAVPPGQYVRLALSDGTRVWLNARSELSYPAVFGRESRHVDLKGEAYFEVARNPERPFTVSAGPVQVEVLGTTFNIKVDSLRGCTDVSLIEGSVAAYIGSEPRGIRLEPRQNLHIEAGTTRITPVGNEDAFLWRTGVVVFDKMPLAEIVRRIEWCYRTRIVIRNPRVGGQVYSGKFLQQDGPYEILRILQKSGRFDLYRDDANNLFEIR